jgi:hypothetical protein
MGMKLVIMLRNDRRLIVSENTVRRHTFGSVSIEMTGDWRKLYSEECHGLYFSPDVFQVIMSKKK